MIIRSNNFHDSLNIALILAPGCEFFSAKCDQLISINIYGMKLIYGHFS